MRQQARFPCYSVESAGPGDRKCRARGPKLPAPGTETAWPGVSLIGTSGAVALLGSGLLAGIVP